MANLYSTTLSGTAQAWQASDSSSLDVASTATWEFWIKPTSAIGSGSLWGLVTKDDINTQRSYAIDYYNNGSSKLVRLGVTSNGTTTYEENSLTYDLGSGTWVHVAVSFDGAQSYGNRISFYINGSYQGHGTAAGSGVTSIFGGTALYGVGCYTSAVPALFAPVQFDEVRLWNTVRTSGEISSNYNIEISSSSSGLVAYHKFENNGTDSTSNANNLTAYGSPTFTSDVPFSGASTTYYPQLLVMTP